MKKRVGIIVDSTNVSKQLADLISLSKNSKNYEIVALVINNVKSNNKNIVLQIASYMKGRKLKKFLSKAIFKIICKIESVIVKRLGNFKESYNKIQLNEDKFVTLNICPQISKSGLIYRYGQEDIERIRELNLNILIRGGSGILRGDILDVCPNGVISFHHADNDINRGGPPGFWEVYNRSPKTGFVIQRLKDELDGGDVIYKGFIATRWFYSMNLLALYEISNPFFHYVLEDITSDCPKLKVHKKSPYSNPLYTIPTPFQSIIYLLKTSFIYISKLLRRLQGKSYRWGVAYQFSENWNEVTLWRSQKIQNPKNKFLADPFVIKKNDNHYCFVEELDYKTNKGNISAYKINPSGYESLGVVLQEDFHLSFPFIFNYENQIYMCPETHEKKEIRLYKCLEFPNKWKFHKTLMKDVSAVDTIIFENNNKWWLFTNFDRSIVHDHTSQLHIFSSDNPLNDEWIPHDSNPVIFDPLFARNGGLIKSDNKIYRIFQRQGFDMYGNACGIARVSQLSTTKYDEEVCSIISAEFFKNIKGTHTYNFDSNLIVHDYVEVRKKYPGV